MKGEKEPGIIIPHLWGAIKLSPTSARGVQLKPRDYLRALLLGTACSKAWQSSRSPLCQWENRPLQVWCSRLSPLSLTPNTSSCFPCSSLWVLPSSGIPLFLLGVLGYMLTCPNLRQSTSPYLRFHLCYPGDNRTCAMIKQLKFMSSLQNSYQQQNLSKYNFCEHHYWYKRFGHSPAPWLSYLWNCPIPTGSSPLILPSHHSVPLLCSYLPFAPPDQASWQPHQELTS